ncbi:SDR family oxidoreductase [Lacinutrix sp. Bg11-31]|uniref:SDR family NAD(P)-dependent oxidoreductase n=1 Tax=Lacinutrix sp. Bg11-31 TaxID=2057808 RepID=UPI000C306798|nr:SDR family oxidoreductase [Lacinutrix sp. Bg11-31]AUC80761.1 short-chain dehydrogenase [Lacinutrix sp. Bg11-31]
MQQTAVITGAASGLGYELMLLLAKDNYNLVLIDIDEEKLKTIQTQLQNTSNSKVKIIATDLSKSNSAASVFNALENTSIDVLVNCAGFGVFGSFADTDWEKESAMLNLHIITITHLTKLVLQGMIDRDHGKILNVSSLAAFQPGPMMALYYASKSYLLSFSEAIANELKDTGVSVTVLCPGPTKTCFQEVVSSSSSNNKISFNMACPKAVAAYGYKAMLKGKVVAVPGVLNKLLANLPRFLSRNRTTSIVRKIQEKNRKEPSNVTDLEKEVIFVEKSI